LSQVRSMTGSGAPVAVVSGHDPDEVMDFPQMEPAPVRSDQHPKTKQIPPKGTIWTGPELSNCGGGDELDDFLVTEMDHYFDNITG